MKKMRSKSIFVIHGHDQGLRNEVVNFLRMLKLTPIVLANKSNSGKTIIEKFEKHADVKYAIALMTPDDKTREGRQARQNVILETEC